ncbi:Exodeoxyribonuclease III xth [Macleaya cordata]|uniref:DNA-(apurinic or apyrimidinic site) endonuclease 2 n=1 Tax=Macleaya cordata TaxID=56857 RepID=A0A200RAC5_MACCD|nr:Exodeoxyribonuclease III xth [Macleaya cordata]
MKIVTYNVNGLRPRISQHGSLLKLLNSLHSDIICFQETKLSKEELTADLIMAEGYESFFSCTCTSGIGRTGYSGVATFCRVNSAFSSKEVALPVAAEEGFTGLLEQSRRSNTRKKDFPLEVSAKVECLLEGTTKEELLKVDSEGRCVITDHGHFVLFNIYGPRAEHDDKERTQFKLTFFNVLQKRWGAFLSQGKRVFVVGDLNIAPAAIDRCDADPKFEENQFRKWLRSLLVERGGPFFDVFRSKHPERTEAYTCWSQRTGAEEFNFGSRIDHILIAGPCLHQDHDMQGHNIIDCHVTECDILTEFKRWKPENTPRWKGGRSIKLEGSDHVPVYVILSELPDLPEHSTPSLAARYVPRIHGFQQTIATLLSKRQVAAKVKNHGCSQLSDENATMGSWDDNSTRSLDYCSVSGSPSIENIPTSNQQCDDISPSINEQSAGIANEAEEETVRVKLRGGTTKPIPPQYMKTTKKAKLGSSSQRTLRSYFQKKPNPSVDVDCGNSDISHGQEDITRQNEYSLLTKELNAPNGDPVVNNENNSFQKNELDLSPSIRHQGDVNACSSSQEDKYSVALFEWQRIQQLMDKHKTVPLCKGHNEPCVSRVVKKPGPNLGRRFYVCGRAEGPSSNPETNCGFFEWAASKSGQKRR